MELYPEFRVVKWPWYARLLLPFCKPYISLDWSSDKGVIYKVLFNKLYIIGETTVRESK